TLAVITASATSMGGITAAVVSRHRSRNKRTRRQNMEQLKGNLPLNRPPIVSPQEWEASREQLLVKEKALTRARDALAAERRRMPWLSVKEKYEFDGPEGKASLLDRFEGRRQLIFCPACSRPGGTCGPA